ncbi:hypothetical protein V5N11_009295 [Cardamine amara subsp. amara]|uniref:Uncharacterized protein n=1 Tax=Cardamine amara subsp. amara TaxID=228776 RepID=A0ABD1AR76_CARAN
MMLIRLRFCRHKSVFPNVKEGLEFADCVILLVCFALSLIWRLFLLSGSLWVAWMKHYLLIYRSFWDVKEGTQGSWVWRKLHKLHDQAYRFLIVQPWDGQYIFFSFDNWLNIEKLMDLFLFSMKQAVGAFMAWPKKYTLGLLVFF